MTYFTVNRQQLTQADIAALPCQQDGTCQETLNQWRSGAPFFIQYDPVWQCTDPNQAFCSANRHDLRADKVFYEVGQEEAVFVPFQAAVNGAFRYKIRFRNRTGQGVGFAPQICLPDSDQIPYCYDPSTIEALRQRADCLLNIWEDHYDDLSLPARNRLNTFLAEHFSYAQEIRNDLPVPITHDGFERLYAELLILQGDESVTRAFASRYDLAGQAIVSFEGSLFETDGIDLSGVAGFEMYSLYQGAQYYSEALDRFYALAPTLYQALQYGQSSRNFVTSELVTAYIERLIRASTQRTRAASEIAKRYQNFNRPDLARRVIERAFAAGYLESIVMSRMMLRIVEVSDIEGRAQLKRQVESAALRYRTALLDMRNVYNDITDQINFFGFAPDYIPFPTVDTRGGGEGNAFEQAMSRALNKLRVAREREELAISADRSFETDTAQFQSELVRIRNTYENQLAEVCGTFEGEDGRVYPGIARYAERSGATAVLGDPCGLVGNGEIHNAQGQVSIQYVELQRLQVQSDNVLESIDIERRRVAQQCGLIQERANFVYEQQGEIISLEDD
ncbi:MAG: hypothetical protein AAFX99_34530, partial [Myxococcota bacterium]